MRTAESAPYKLCNTQSILPPISRTAALTMAGQLVDLNADSHHSYPGRYMLDEPSTFWDLPRVLPQTGSSGVPLGQTGPIIKTDTTSVQLEPRIVSNFPAITARQERVGQYNTGEFLFNINPWENQDGLHVTKSLWDFNFCQKRKHEAWKVRMKKLSDPAAFLEQSQTSNKRSRSGNLLDDLDQKKIHSMKHFTNQVFYAGISEDPAVGHIHGSDAGSKDSSVRIFVLKQKGRQVVPNIWGNVTCGDRVGLLVKKFTNPMPFLQDNLTTESIIENMCPLEIWPVVGMGGPGALHGGEFKSSVVDVNIPSNHKNSLMWRLPSEGRSIKYAERDPMNVDASYFDYEVTSTDMRDGQLKLNGTLKIKSALYIHIGRVHKPYGEAPSLQQICSAVQPYGSHLPDIGDHYTQLLSNYPLEVFVESPGFCYFY